MNRRPLTEPLRPLLWFAAGACVVTALLTRAVLFPLAGPAHVTAAEQQTKPEPTLQPGDCHLGSSRVYVFVGKTGFGHEHAIEGRLKSGALHLSDRPASGRLVFDMTSFAADTPGARKYIGLAGVTDPETQKKVNANMLGPDVLDVRRFPAAGFMLTAVTPLQQQSRRGLPQYQLDGQFTLHGVTRPVRIVAETETKGTWLHLRGSFAIRQTDFGITPFSTAFGAVGVTNDLRIYGDLWVAQPGPVTERSPQDRR
ncbi:MAG: YceI family protein [Planctomycetaceae bacterium]|nr:YceI family protein [Planctomycetaceae bacterium]